MFDAECRAFEDKNPIISCNKPCQEYVTLSIDSL